MYDLAVGLVKYMLCQSLFITAFINIHMNECNEIWALYEQTAAQPPQYQPTNNDKKASQLNAAAQKPQVAPQVNVQVMPQPPATVRAPSPMAAAPAPSVVSQDAQQVQDEQEEYSAQPVASKKNIGNAAFDVANAADNVMDIRNLPKLASTAKSMYNAAAPAVSLTKSIPRSGMLAAVDPVLTAAEYAYDPKAFNDKLNAKDQQAMDSYGQGIKGKLKHAGQSVVDGVLSPTESMIRGVRAGTRARAAVNDVARSYADVQTGAALTPAARQKARQMGMLKDNFNNVIDSLQHQLLK